MVRTGNVDFSCKRLTSIEIRKSKYHIIKTSAFSVGTPPPPLRKISGSPLDESHGSKVNVINAFSKIIMLLGRGVSRILFSSSSECIRHTDRKADRQRIKE